jgi:hypothetical protein
MKTATTENKTIEVFPFVGNNTERNKRLREAQAYSDNLAKEKANRKHRINITVETATNIVLVVAIIAMVVAIIAKALSGTENGFYKRTTEMQPDGNYFVYVTERICEVEEINNDLVTVEYKGKLYDFFGYGYEVGEQIICQFTNDWEIVGVSE